MKLADELRDFGEYIVSSLSDAAISFEVCHDELMLRVDRDNLLVLMGFLHDDGNCQFKMLMDLCGVDYVEREELERFDVVYNLLSLKYNRRIRVKTSTDEKTPVPSVTGLYPVAGWFEREAWDMYGILFSGNSDLRRILTDYGFDGHPLRKDFPLSGYIELRYDSEEKRIVTEPVNLTQAYRDFSNENPWVGYDGVAVEKGDDAA